MGPCRFSPRQTDQFARKAIDPVLVRFVKRNPVVIGSYLYSRLAAEVGEVLHMPLQVSNGPVKLPKLASTDDRSFLFSFA